MLKAPVEDCVAKNADSAVPERKRAPKKAKKGKEDATQTEPAAAARGKTVQQAAKKGKGGAKPAGQAEADQGDQAPKGSGGAKRSQKKKAAAPTAGGEGGTQSDERVEDKGKDPMDESLTYGRKDDADRRKSLAKTPVANTGAKKKRKKSQGGTSGGSGAAAPSNADPSVDLLQCPNAHHCFSLMSCRARPPAHAHRRHSLLHDAAGRRARPLRGILIANWCSGLP